MKLKTKKSVYHIYNSYQYLQSEAFPIYFQTVVYGDFSGSIYVVNSQSQSRYLYLIE